MDIIQNASNPVKEEGGRSRFYVWVQRKGGWIGDILFSTWMTLDLSKHIWFDAYNFFFVKPVVQIVESVLKFIFENFVSQM